MATTPAPNNTDPRDEEYLTVSEVAKTFDVGEQTIRRWAKNGVLPRVEITAWVHRWRRSDVEKLIRDGTT